MVISIRFQNHNAILKSRADRSMSCSKKPLSNLKTSYGNRNKNTNRNIILLFLKCNFPNNFENFSSENN